MYNGRRLNPIGLKFIVSGMYPRGRPERGVAGGCSTACSMDFPTMKKPRRVSAARPALGQEDMIQDCTRLVESTLFAAIEEYTREKFQRRVVR